MFVCPNAADPKKTSLTQIFACQKNRNFFVTFNVHRDPEDEDVNNNIHPLPPLKSASQNSCNKVPVKFSEESPRFTGELFC